MGIVLQTDKSIVLDSIFLSSCLILLCMPIHICTYIIFICSSCSYMRCASVKRRFRRAIFVTKFSSLISSDCKHAIHIKWFLYIFNVHLRVDMGSLSLFASIHFIYSWLFYVNRCSVEFVFDVRCLISTLVFVFCLCCCCFCSSITSKGHHFCFRWCGYKVERWYHMIFHIFVQMENNYVVSLLVKLDKFKSNAYRTTQHTKKKESQVRTMLFIHIRK